MDGDCRAFAAVPRDAALPAVEAARTAPPPSLVGRRALPDLPHMFTSRTRPQQSADFSGMHRSWTVACWLLHAMYCSCCMPRGAWCVVQAADCMLHGARRLLAAWPPVHVVRCRCMLRVVVSFCGMQHCTTCNVRCCMSRAFRSLLLRVHVAWCMAVHMLLAPNDICMLHVLWCRLHLTCCSRACAFE